MEIGYIKMEILEIGMLVLAAYLGGLVARRLKIGEVTGQILGGVFVGPGFLKLVFEGIEKFNLHNLPLISFFYNFYVSEFSRYTRISHELQFFIFLFLGIIAFSLGEELHRDRVKSVGWPAVIICALQAFLTFGLVALGFWLFMGFTLVNAFIIGSIAVITAPALTFILMNMLKIEGDLRKILANVLVLDGLIEVVMFSIFLGAAVLMKSGNSLSFGFLAGSVLKELFFACLIGAIIFVILKFTITKNLKDEVREEHKSFLSTILSEHPTPSVEILLITMAVVSIGIAVSMHFHLPFLITAIVGGFLISNFHSHAIFDSLKVENVMPIFNLFFFAIIGTTIDFGSFSKDTIWLTTAYLVLRSAGKIVGTWVGCRMTAQDPKITACLPKLMLPQAGMAAVETILVAAVIAGYGGQEIFNTVIPALVIFQLGGAILSEQTLLKWKTWIVDEQKILQGKKKVNYLDFSMYGLIENRVFDLYASNREEAVFELAKYAVQHGLAPDTSAITGPVLEREKLASTGIGDGFAFPHCRTSWIDKATVVCGLSESSLEWNSLDGKPVDCLFLILTPAEKPKQHLQALQTISMTLREPNFKEGISNALKSGSVEDYLQKHSEVK